MYLPQSVVIATILRKTPSGCEHTNRLIAGGFSVTAGSRIDRPCGQYCCFNFITLDVPLLLPPALVDEREQKARKSATAA